jgi:TPP-dependent pyruvate/acetoin dehydrogenase alpha subunit
MWSDEKEESIRENLLLEIDNAWQSAMLDPYPLKTALLNHVYFEAGQK